MPIRRAIENLTIDPNDFDVEKIKAELIREFEADETSWKAAVETRDKTLTETTAKLTAAQAAAWELLNSQPVKQDEKTSGTKPEDGEDDETVVTDDDMFTQIRE